MPPLLAGKEPSIADGGLPQTKVAGLVADLATKATTASLTSGLAGKQDTIADAGLPQAKVAGLVSDLAGKASAGALAISQVNQLQSQIDAKASVTQLTSGLAGKEPTIVELPQSKVAGLIADLAARATTASLTSGLAGKVSSQQLADAIAGRQASLTPQSNLVVDTVSSRLYLDPL